MYTAATAMLEGLVEAGVSYLFANLGSDHSAIVEAYAEAKSSGQRLPKLITCPHEMVALTAAQGYAQITGRPQAVLVHVECGTQQLAGAIHNVSRCRTPVLIFAGASPATQEGELRGGRNEFIHWLQDTFDQRGIVRGYMKYENEIRNGRNAKQVIFRALQFTMSDPKGPAYLMAAREVFEQDVDPIHPDPALWAPITPAGIPDDSSAELAADLQKARRPLIVTSYAGRNPEAVGEMVSLCRRLGVGVLESAPSDLNFPSDDAMYQGNQSNEPFQNPVLAEADVVVVLDCDVPWIPQVNKPAKNAKIYHIDVDPLKEQMPLWYIPANRVFRADAATALRQVFERAERAGVDEEAARVRCVHYTQLHEKLRRSVAEAEQPKDGVITVEYLVGRLREQIGRDTVVLNESITNFTPVNNHLGSTKPRTRFTSGASSLGWNGGAAVGMKLAHPEKTVVTITGDGSYMFSVPSTVHWMARRYKTPFLQVILNNGGWRAPKFSALGVRPAGNTSKAHYEDLGIAFDPAPDYAGIAAAAGGALALRVENPADVDKAIADGLRAVREEGRSAVLDVKLAHL